MNEQILQILIEAGDKGIKINKLCLHVFNACNGLFSSVSREEVRQHVYNYVRLHSSKPGMLLERVKWGVYRINTNSRAYRNLLVRMRKSEDERQCPSTSLPTDKQPTLF